jgi:hypothetical protein
LAFLVLNSLPYAQLFDRDTIQGGMVEKQVATLALDKPKTFVDDQFLDRTLWHFCHSSTKNETKERHSPSPAVGHSPSANVGPAKRMRGANQPQSESRIVSNAAKRNAV